MFGRGYRPLDFSCSKQAIRRSGFEYDYKCRDAEYEK